MKTPALLFLLVVLLLVLACAPLACAHGETGFFPGGADAAPSAQPQTDPPPELDATTVIPIGDDSGIVIVSASGDSSPPDDAEAAAAATGAGPPFDAGEGGVCPQPIAPGSLAIVELMIESTSGTGDHGEWLEVASTLGCAVNLRGLRGECPLGAKVRAFDVESDLWLPALGTFLVADSSDPAVNHELPGAVVAWSGDPGDVLRNDGATITLLWSGAIIDSVTYPKLKLAKGASMAFPSDCARGLRNDWTSWQTTTSSWFPGFAGTPNAPNDDVHCPVQADN